jgi:mannose-1-phosphate guanylyltransferase
MKAVVLAAGAGTRLQPLTLERPKPLLDIAGRSLLARITGNLVAAGVDAIAVNAHTHVDQVRSAVRALAEVAPCPVLCIEEPALTGTGGGVACLVDALDAGDEPVLVHYGDILLDQDLAGFMAGVRHEQTRLLIHERVGGNSIIELSSDDQEDFRVVRFIERPRQPQPTAHWSFSGLAVVPPSIHGRLPRGVPSDLIREGIVPAVETGRVIAHPLRGHRVAVDSVERLEQARNLVGSGAYRGS